MTISMCFPSNNDVQHVQDLLGLPLGHIDQTMLQPRNKAWYTSLTFSVHDSPRNRPPFLLRMAVISGTGANFDAERPE